MFALPAMCIGFAMIIIDANVLNVALPAIYRDLGGGLDGLLWVVNGYTLLFATLLLTSGALGDRLGAKPVFLVGLTLFTTASLLCSLVPNIDLLIATRALQGVGAALLAPASLALITHAYPDVQKRARAVGVWSAISGVGFAGGPILGGLLVDSFGWRSIFLVNVPIGIVALALTYRFVAASPRSLGRNIDLLGQVLSIFALVPLTSALIESRRFGWTALPVILGFVFAAVAMMLFLLVECRARHPMLPLRFFASPVFTAANVVAFFYNFGLYGLLLVLSLFLQGVQGLSALATGLTFLPLTLTYVFTTWLFAGRLTAWAGPRLPLAAGTFCCCLGTLVIAWIGKNGSIIALISGLIPFGFGIGMTMTAMTAAVLSSVQTTQSGTASAVLTTSRQVGGVLGPAITGMLISGTSVASGMHIALLMVAAGFSLGFFLTLVVVPRGYSSLQKK